MGHTQVSPDTHLVGKHLIEAHLDLVTIGRNLTKVSCYRRLSEVSRNSTLTTAYQDVATLVVEELNGTGEQATEKSVVDTDIGLLLQSPNVHWGYQRSTRDAKRKEKCPG